MASKFPMEETEVVSLQPKGLYTWPNPLSAVPQGAMIQALNVILSRPYVVEQRRGVNTVGPAFSGAISKLYNFQNQIIASHGTTLSYFDADLSAKHAYSGSYSAPTGAITIHSFQGNKNAYFTTSTGVKKLDTIAGSIVAAGAPAGLDGSGSTTGSGWFTNSTQVAYRILLGYTDANNNLILGAPSQRIVVSNSSGGATNVSLTFTLPSGLTTSWVYQIYRSPMSADLNTEPNDECALVYTGNPTSGQLAAGTVPVTDSIDDSLKGAMIYTASSQQGIAQANYQPPIATDAAFFKGFAMYANTTSQQQILLTLVAVGSPALQLNDTVTIAGTTYTAKAGETIASAEFQLFTGGTPSQNITNTANSLVRVINRYATNTTVYAYYSSGYADLPGRITVRERNIGGGTFTAACSRAGTFVPDIKTATATSVSQNTPNRVYISKFQQPESVPLLQYEDIGSADKSILRIIALRDYVLVFKQDGVFQISGSDIGSFQVQEVDKTVILRGLETAVALNNKVYMFSNQTVISLTFNEGAVLKSQPIKKDLLILSSPQYANFDTVSYGIAYESENEYLLGTVTNTTDTTCTQYFVYNYLTDTWTSWQFPFTMGCGFVNPTDNKLYFGSSDSSSKYLYQERKDFAETDFADNSYAVSITGSSGTTVSLVSTTNVSVGFTLAQADRKAVVTAVVNGTTLTVDKPFSWTVAAAAVHRPIDVAIRFAPEACGNPGIVKHFKEVHSIFSTADFDSFNLGFYTDFYQSINTTTLTPKIANGWGIGSWGQFPWGSGAPELQVIRGIVPLPQRRGHWLNLVVNYSVALSNFALDGFTLYYQAMSQKFH